LAQSGKKKKVIVRKKKLRKHISSLTSALMKKSRQEGSDDFDSDNSISQLEGNDDPNTTYDTQ
jgi:hypothetical protein